MPREKSTVCLYSVCIDSRCTQGCLDQYFGPTGVSEISRTTSSGRHCSVLDLNATRFPLTQLLISRQLSCRNGHADGRASYSRTFQYVAGTATYSISCRVPQPWSICSKSESQCDWDLMLMFDVYLYFGFDYIQYSNRQGPGQPTCGCDSPSCF